ncbi:hypothetical protein [Streptomyces canus]|uniref:hypothetical protein n=1 Tax=Streptomyces canus TaxID=58343 RepID=UPI0033A51404
MFDVVPLKGIDPVVVMAQLEAILTGCTFDEASERPPAGQALSSPESESALIVFVEAAAGLRLFCWWAL